jgi:hypothetical protein
LSRGAVLQGIAIQESFCDQPPYRRRDLREFGSGDDAAYRAAYHDLNRRLQGRDVWRKTRAWLFGAACATAVSYGIAMLGAWLLPMMPAAHVPP